MRRGLRPLAGLTRPPRGAVGAVPSQTSAKGERRIQCCESIRRSIEVIERLRPVIAQVEAHDRDLARQWKRAAASMLLNVGEGERKPTAVRGESAIEARSGRQGRQRACLDAALALGYVESVDAGLLDRLDHVRATLVRNVA